MRATRLLKDAWEILREARLIGAELPEEHRHDEHNIFFKQRSSFSAKIFPD
jgi:hypothetical protein